MEAEIQELVAKSIGKPLEGDPKDKPKVGARKQQKQLEREFEELSRK